MLNAEPELQGIVAVDGLGDVEAQGGAFDQAEPGDVDAETFQGHTVFTGTLQLHGTKNKVEGVATIRREGSRVRVEAGFPVALADFGIPKPQYLGVGVKSTVQVKVALTAIPEGAPR